MVRGYDKIISEATGETDPKRLAKIEDIMRNDIFHSTLDWQTKRQLTNAAREAVKVMKIMDDMKKEGY